MAGSLAGQQQTLYYSHLIGWKLGHREVKWLARVILLMMRHVLTPSFSLWWRKILGQSHWEGREGTDGPSAFLTTGGPSGLVQPSHSSENGGRANR